MGLFKEYMADPSCASIRVTEDHAREVSKTEASTHWWQSWWEIKDRFHAHVSEENMSMAKDVAAKANDSYQHASYPDNPNWMMYEVPKEHTISKLTSEMHQRSTQAEGLVTDPAAVQSLLNIASASQIRDVSVGAPTGRGRGGGGCGGFGRGRDRVIKDAGALAIAKKVNLGTEANQLNAKITKFHLNILDLEQSKSTEYDHAVLKDAYAQKTLADTLLAEYRTMQLDRGTEEPTKVL